MVRRRGKCSEEKEARGKWMKGEEKKDENEISRREERE